MSAMMHNHRNEDGLDVIIRMQKAKFKDDPRVVVMGAWDGQVIPAGVLKVDCEGCERGLTTAMLSMYPEFVIGLHPDILGPDLEKQLQQLIYQAGGQYWGMDAFISREFIYGKRNQHGNL